MDHRKRTYSAFTLVEMLIVMGIIVILMAVGITAGRYAINRANEVAHRNAVDQIYQALQAYYTDNREFPDSANTVQTLVTTDTLLGKYMDSGTFDGGTDATYIYLVDTNQQQAALVCVSLGGFGDEKELGYYCNGNGFNADDMPVDVTEKDVASTDAAYTTIDGTAGSNWTNSPAEGATSNWSAYSGS